MKYKELLQFIEQQVKELVASETNEVSTPNAEPVSTQICKPVTINIKKEKPKERDLEEKDFEEIMFFKLDEEESLRQNIRKIIRESALANVLKGGKGDTLTPKDVDPKELSMGIKVEKEHTDDLKIAKEIALDHLAENPKYYTDIKSLEDKEKK